MAVIRAFPALRYDPAKVPVEHVVTQPYDKITPEMQERYHCQHAYNLVRIILGKPEPGDDGSNVYTRAADRFRRWREEGVLRPDPRRAIYAYHQRFTMPGAEHSPKLERQGFIALGRIEDYSAGVVFRHEQTLAKPKEDRLRLLRATRAHFGQLFMLYGDPPREINPLLTPQKSPDIEVSDEYGVRHQVWALTDPALIQRVRERMAEKRLIIADGHHRYETALTYRNEKRLQGSSGPGTGASSDAPYEYVMMTFISMDAEGLVILPTHRVVFGLPGFDRDLMLRGAWGYFEIQALPDIHALPQLLARLEEAGRNGNALLAVVGHDAFLLQAKPGAANALLAGVSTRQRQLDVVQLHKVLLEHVMGISEEDIREQRNIKYLRSAEQAIEEVQRGANAAFLMNPVSIEQVREIAFAGEVLPQKSTDFYPKLLSGLTIYALD